MFFQKIKDVLQGKAPFSAKRSSQWARVRAKHLQTQPVCSVCGGSSALEVHHILPFHSHPDLELTPSNLITLCEAKKNGVNCHLWFGHLGDYRAVNHSVVNDAQAWSTKFRVWKKYLAEHKK